MRLVAIAARHACVEHPALAEGAVLIVLLLYLPVREIVILIEQRDAVVVADGLSVHIVFVNLAAPRMASRAHLNFPLRLTRRASTCVARCGIDRPRHPFALVERDGQALGCVEFLPIALLLRPRHMI